MNETKICASCAHLDVVDEYCLFNKYHIDFCNGCKSWAQVKPSETMTLKKALADANERIAKLQKVISYARDIRQLGCGWVVGLPDFRKALAELEDRDETSEEGRS